MDSGPLICSYVIENLSWEFGFWFVSIPLGMTVIMVFFFVPEVSQLALGCDGYETVVHIQQTTFNRVEAVRHAAKRDADRSSLEKPSADAEVESVDRVSQPRPPTYVSQLKIWHGTFTDESIWKIFLRPFPFLLSPVVRTYRHEKGRWESNSPRCV